MITTMNPDQKTKTFSIEIRGEIPQHKKWFKIMRDKDNRAFLEQTDRVPMWEYQFSQLVKQRVGKKLTVDVDLSVFIYTRRDSDSRRLSESILKVIEKYVTSGKVRSWNVRQIPVSGLLDVRSAFEISPRH
jgi:hypothetical protein